MSTWAVLLAVAVAVLTVVLLVMSRTRTPWVLIGYVLFTGAALLLAQQLNTGWGGAAVIAVISLATLVAIVFALRHQANPLFLALVSLTLLLVGVAVYRDTQARDYLAIQEQYQRDYGAVDTKNGQLPNFNIQIQQIFPQFQGGKRGDAFRVERCISCHVPNIDTISPQEAAQRLACDFFKYEPNAMQLKQEFGLKSTPGVNGGCTSEHPIFIDANYYKQYGPSAVPKDKNGNPITAKDANGNTLGPLQGGYLPANVDPANPANPQLGLNAVGCVVCHNGNRLGVTEADAHGMQGCVPTGDGAQSPPEVACANLNINPEYSWSAGAALYYQYCVICHGAQGEGGIGPPLSNQDRLGYFNEDYYQRCIEYGLTDFEHYGSVMPDWGSTAPDFHYDPGRDLGYEQHYNKKRVLTEDQIILLTQFIRHWEQYDTLP